MSNKPRSAADDAAIEAKIEVERRSRLGEAWSGDELEQHLSEYREELRYQFGWPTCSRCHTADPSVQPGRLAAGDLICQFCAEDLRELASDAAEERW